MTSVVSADVAAIFMRGIGGFRSDWIGAQKLTCRLSSSLDFLDEVRAKDFVGLFV
jgi:beta-lactamase superfamily II metal-dependent hydrolase